MTHREPDQRDMLVTLTWPPIMATLFSAPAFIIGYGAWFFGSAAAVGIGRWLT